MKSLARVMPISRRARWVPPLPGIMPSRISGNANSERSVAMRKSQATASSRPAPIVIPVDGGDDRLAAALGRGQRVAPQLEVGGRQREELGDVAARAERLAAGAADHDHAHARRRPRAPGRCRGTRCAWPPSSCSSWAGGRSTAWPPAPALLDAQELAHVVISVYWPSRSRRRRILPDAVLGISRDEDDAARALEVGEVGGCRGSGGRAPRR